MIKLVTTAEMRAIEVEADAHGWTYQKMVEQAGLGLAKVVYSISSGGKRVLGLVGSGNNGADTLVALEELGRLGMHPSAYLAQPRPDDDSLVMRLVAAGYLVISTANDPSYTTLAEMITNSDELLDGFFGTGFRHPMKPEAGKLLGFVKNSLTSQRVFAVDCPSGVDCNTGEASEESLKADITICMAAVKTGLLQFPAFGLAGDLVVVDIGLPKELPTWQKVSSIVADASWVSAQLPRRPLDAHKGTFGTVTVCAGSINYTGAANLAGKAAYRVGAGLVQMAVAGPLHSVLAGQFPEATWVLLPHDSGVIREDASEVLLRNLGRTTCLLLGPGWDLEETTGEFLNHLLDAPAGRNVRSPIGFLTGSSTENQQAPVKLPALVIDADGLKHLAKMPDWVKRLPAQTILTPHAGEMSVLTGLPVCQIQKERWEVARKFAVLWNQIVVLKGANTIVASPDGRAGVVPVATPGLARAGTGDVLAGMIAGLRAQGVEGYEAALAGSWIHGTAALFAVEHVGHSASVMAGDVLENIARALQQTAGK